MNTNRLAIITTHPIQYNAPWFRLLAERKHIAIKVFYTWGQAGNEMIYDPGFGKNIAWDIPLLEGYDHCFVHNEAKEPGTRHYNGIVNPTLIKEINDWKPSSILIFGWNFKSHWQCLRYFHGKIPVLFRGDSTLLNEKGGYKRLLRRIVLRWVYKKVDTALYVGTENKLYFKAHGLKEAQLVFAPHAIDNARFMEPDAAYSKDALEWRNRWGIAAGVTVFLYAGKFEHVKNPAIIIEIAKRLAGLPVHFVLAGNGPLEQEIKQAAGKNVSFIGFQNQSSMPVLYRCGDVFLLPSRSETWGLSVNEAMACGRPVIISDACGCAADLVSEGENGYVFSSADIDSLEKKIRLLLDNKKQLHDMGKVSLYTIADYSFERIAAQVERIVSNPIHL